MITVSCPQCGAEVQSQFEFGMVECLSCKHVFMLDGQIAPLMETPQVAEPPMETFTPTESTGPENFAADVVNFANSEVPAHSSGALYYNIEISGLDTPELKQELENILEDKKLGLVPSGILSKINEGRVRLAKLHPVRAAVLVNRLRQTNLQVKWSTDQMIKSLLIILFISFRAFAGSWEGHDASLKNYSIRINNLQDEIRDQIVKKNAETDQKKREAFLEEIKKKYAELRGYHRDFLKEMEHVRYQHPERGDKVERKYKHYKVKTLEELENDNSLDGQLSKMKRKVDLQYKK